MSETKCWHGCVTGVRIASDEDVNMFMDDLRIIENNLMQAVPSKKVEKKARARLEKAHRAYVRADGKSNFLAGMYGAAANAILEPNMDIANAFCRGGLYFQLRVWNENNHTEKELLTSVQKIRTNRGLILHVASRIPCQCLNQLKRAAKANPRVAMCDGCEEEKPFDDTLQCSGCKMKLYCSEDCQRKHWKEHKADCHKWARMEYMKELKETESG